MSGLPAVRKNAIVPALGKNGVRNKQKNTNEASMLLKTNKCMSETNSKRTPVECSEPKFELSDIAHGGAGNSIVGDVAGIGIARCVSTQKYKNSGNEAKNYLKTKDITFYDAANYARIACKSARI